MASDPVTTWFDLMRHGEPRGGPKYRGHLDDPLSELGWQQMRDGIREEDHWDVVLTSTLSRCQAFAEEIATARALPLHRDPALREIHFGDWEGLSAAEIQQREPGRLAAFWRNAVDHPPPGGETIPDFQQRIVQAWTHWQEALRGQRVLLVCHGGVIRMVLGHVMAMPPGVAMASLQVPYACRSRVRLDHSEHGNLSCLIQHGSLD